jgi:nucleoside-diphosphate-sugar epimerase
MGRAVYKKHLVLGNKGFIGSHLYEYLRSKDYEVGGLDLVDKVDLRDYKQCLHVTKGYAYVYLMAADMGGVGYLSEEQYSPPLNNYLIDLNILRACEVNKVERLFYPSSACAYNTSFEGAPLEEEMLNLSARPDQMYGWEKLTMIKLMRHAPFNVRVGVLHTIYGEGQEYEGKKAKFPPQMSNKILKAVMTGKVNVWGDGTQTRTFLHIDDAVEKIHEVMMVNHYHGEVNIGSDKEVSVNEVIKVCCDILDISPEIEYDTTKPTGPARRLCSNEKFNKYYKTRDRVFLREGFARLIGDISENV